MKTDFDSNLARRISFVLTTKNRAPYLEKALQNFKELLGENDELIIVDCNSTDGTREIIRRNLDFINIFISEEDEGQGHAFNKGLFFSNGKYICLLTDDDIFFQKAIEKAVKIMDTNPDIDVLIPGGMKERNGKKWYVYMPVGSDFGKNVKSLYTNSWCGIGIFIRTNSIAKAGLSDPRSVALDNSYIAQFISKGLNVKFARINMYYHRIYEHSSTVAKFNAWEEDYLGIIKKYCSRSFYYRYRWWLLKRKITWLKYFQFIEIPLRFIEILFNEGPVILFKKIKRRIIVLDDQEKNNNLIDKASVIWDGTIN